MYSLVVETSSVLLVLERAPLDGACLVLPIACSLDRPTKDSSAHWVVSERFPDLLDSQVVRCALVDLLSEGWADSVECSACQ